MRHIIPISGKDSLCAAIVQMARRPELPYEFLFCDVRMELPETYAWLGRVEKSLGVEIVRVGKSLEDVIAEKGMLPSHGTRFCTQLGKIHPLLEYVGKDTAIQYLGIRADEGERAGAGFAETRNVRAKFPLIETGIDLPAVYGILEREGLLPPDFFWRRLYDTVYSVVPEEGKAFIDGLKSWQRSQLFCWRSRSNCFMCFYQSSYEWLGLLEHHPDLFLRAAKLESEFGGKNDNRVKSFYWRQDGPLANILFEEKSIFNRRVSKVREAVRKMYFTPAEDGIDMLSLVSCGAYCGK